MCVVEVKGARSLVTSCVYPVNDGMEIITNSPKVLESRKTNLELLLSTHDQNCLSCIRSTDCELQTLCHDYGVNGTRFVGSRNFFELETSTLHLVRDNNTFILCSRLLAVSHNHILGFISPADRGFDTSISSRF